MKGIRELCDLVRKTSYAIHVYHGHGHLEKVYENALAHRLGKAGLDVRQQHPIMVFDEDGTTIGEYFADLFVEETLIVELEACRALAAEHTAQILAFFCGYSSLFFFSGHQILLAKSSQAHTFPALYAKGDCKTQNEESRSEAL